MSMRQREKVQAVLRGKRIVFILLAASLGLQAQDSALWKEYGLVRQETSRELRSTTDSRSAPKSADVPLSSGGAASRPVLAGGKGLMSVTTYQMKDLTGALAAWESLRSPAALTCDLAPFCTSDGKKVIVTSENYVVEFSGAKPAKQDVEEFLKTLPNKRDSGLPAILTFLPKQGRVANSARYVLGPVSLKSFAPELIGSKPGFEDGAEAQVASYRLKKNEAPVRLALFDYATPEMARLHVANFRGAAGIHVKRSGLLVAAVLGGVSDEAADTLLSRVEYEAKITWNESPEPSPVKPMYRLFVNILYMSALLSLLGLTAGLFYAGMRIYRRRYGTLEADEAMTTLHLTRE